MTVASPSPGKPGRVTTGHPVDVASGSVYTAWTDIALRGYVPVRWRRFYNSANPRRTPNGVGWSTLWDMELRRHATEFSLIDDEGVEITLHAAGPGQFSNPGAEMELESREDQLVVNHWHHAQRYVFDRLPNAPDCYRLTAVENMAGDRVLALYSQDDRLAEIAMPGRRLVMTYDGIGNIAALDLFDHRGARFPVAQFRHDGAGHLVEATDACGGRLTYAYDDASRLVRETNPNGGSFYFRYDKRGRCCGTWGDDGYLGRTLQYDATTRTTVVEDTRGARTSYVFDEANRLIRQVDPDGQVSQTLRAAGTVQKLDPLGHVQTLVFDEAGHLTRQLDGADAVSEWAYNVRHQLTHEIDADGGQWRYEYDEAGGLSRAIDAGGHEWIIRTNAHGAISEVVDPLGGCTHYEYDDFGNRTLRRSPIGKVTHFGYDVFGRLRTMRTPAGVLFEYDYDACGRLTELRSAARVVQRMGYDAGGNLTVVDRPGARRVTNRYNPFGLRLAQFQGRSPRASATWVYDREAAVTRFQDGGGRGADNSYDHHGRLWRRRYDDGSEDVYSYDAIGRVIRLDRDSAAIEFSYNAASRLAEKRLPNGSVTSFVYNKRRQMVGARNEHSEIELERDWAGRVVRETQNGLTCRHVIDARGCRVGTTFADGTKVGFAYDASRELVSASIGPALSHSFGSTGLTTSHDFPNGVREQLELTMRNLKLRQRAFPRGNPFSAVIDREYQLRPDGTIVGISEPSGPDLAFGYDENGWLISATPDNGSPELWTYDPSGNLVATRSGNRSFDAKNRITAADGQPYRFDAKRRSLSFLEHGQQTELLFDAEDRLRFVRRPNAPVVEYRYDALGRRIAKLIGSAERRFHYDGDRIAMEIDAQSGEEHLYVHRPGSFRPLSKRVTDDKRCKPAEWYHYHLDLRGAPLALSGARGEVAWRAEWTPFGATRVVVGDLSLNPIRLPGQYADLETGLSYNRFRYYNPDLACYLTADPIGYNGGVNLFRYTRDPFGQVDPLGLDCGDPNRVHLYHGTLDEDALRASGFRTTDKYGGEAEPPYVCVSTDPAAARDAIDPNTRYDAQYPDGRPAVLSGSMSQGEYNGLIANGDLSTNNYNGFGHNLGGTSETKAETPAGVAALNRAFGLPGG